MSFRRLKYFLVYLSPLVVVISIVLGGVWTYLALLIFFVVIPCIELFTRVSTRNLSTIEEELAKEDVFYDLLLYGLVPVQYGLMIFFLNRVSDPALQLYEKIGMMTAFGMACGILGINAAHELGHRSSMYERVMSKMLLLTSLYMHFYIEHNRGHHKNVSTDEDPASGRKGEAVYNFYIRSIIGSWFSAWRLESSKLKKNKKKSWSIYNEMLHFQLLQLALIFAIAYIYNWQTMLFFIGSAVIGIHLLETVNYIEHYGLRRKKNGDQYERAMPMHSWNSNHPLGRLMLLELSRHSDHHYLASRKYQLLRHHEESPQMPTGYPGMLLLALVPPLWFRVMDKEIEKYKLTTEGRALA